MMLAVRSFWNAFDCSTEALHCLAAIVSLQCLPAKSCFEHAGWEGSKAAPRPQHLQHTQHANAAAASHRCLSAVTRCLWHCEYFVQGLLSTSPVQLQRNPALPALAEVLRAWARADDKVPNRAKQEQLGAAVSMLQDALASTFPQLFKQGDQPACVRVFLHHALALTLSKLFTKSAQDLNLLTIRRSLAAEEVSHPRGMLQALWEVQDPNRVSGQEKVALVKPRMC